jgi:hypothetical protein
MPERLIPLARQRIAEGKLPAVMAHKTYGGFSAGGICALCLHPIDKKTPEVEVVLQEPVQVHVMHPACFAAWSTAIREPEIERA